MLLLIYIKQDLEITWKTGEGDDCTRCTSLFILFLTPVLLWRGRRKKVSSLIDQDAGLSPKKGAAAPGCFPFTKLKQFQAVEESCLTFGQSRVGQSRALG